MEFLLYGALLKDAAGNYLEQDTRITYRAEASQYVIPMKSSDVELLTNRSDSFRIENKKILLLRSGYENE